MTTWVERGLLVVRLSVSGKVLILPPFYFFQFIRNSWFINEFLLINDSFKKKTSRDFFLQTLNAILQYFIVSDFWIVYLSVYYIYIVFIFLFIKLFVIYIVSGQSVPSVVKSPLRVVKWLYLNGSIFHISGKHDFNKIELEIRGVYIQNYIQYINCIFTRTPFHSYIGFYYSIIF